MTSETKKLSCKQENQILKQAKEIEHVRMWNKAKRKGFPTSNGLHGQQYCMNCHTIWNCEYSVPKDKRFLETCLVCNPKERNY